MPEPDSLQDAEINDLDREQEDEKSAAVPAKPKTHAPRIDKIFRASERMEASDVHLKAGSPPRVRVRGQIKAMAMGPLSGSHIDKMLAEIITPEQLAHFQEEGALDFGHQVEGGSRFRINAFRQRNPDVDCGPLHFRADQRLRRIAPAEGAFQDCPSSPRSRSGLGNHGKW